MLRAGAEDRRVIGDRAGGLVEVGRCEQVGLRCVTCGTETQTRPADVEAFARAHLWPTLASVTLDTGEGPVTYACEPIAALTVFLDPGMFGA
jgi:hypothetical protein